MVLYVNLTVLVSISILDQTFLFQPLNDGATTMSGGLYVLKLVDDHYDVYLKIIKMIDKLWVEILFWIFIVSFLVLD